MTNARLEELRTRFQENPRRYFAPFANELRKSGDKEQAITICRTHLASQPGHVSGHIVLAQALHEAGQSAEARDVFTAALELDPENLIALRTMGDMSYSEGEFTGARHWYERLLDADPRNQEIVQLLSHLPESVPGSAPEASPVSVAAEAAVEPERVESAAESAGKPSADAAPIAVSEVELLDGLMPAAPEAAPDETAVDAIDLQPPVEDTGAHQPAAAGDIDDLETFLAPPTAAAPDESSGVTAGAGAGEAAASHEPPEPAVFAAGGEDEDWTGPIDGSSFGDRVAAQEPTDAAGSPDAEPALEIGDEWSMAESAPAIDAGHADWVAQSEPETMMEPEFGSGDDPFGSFPASTEDAGRIEAADDLESWQVPAGPSAAPGGAASDAPGEWSLPAEPSGEPVAGTAGVPDEWSLPAEPASQPLAGAGDTRDVDPLMVSLDAAEPAQPDGGELVESLASAEAPDRVPDLELDVASIAPVASEFDLAIEASDPEAAPEPSAAAPEDAVASAPEPADAVFAGLPDEPTLDAGEEPGAGDAAGSVTAELLSTVAFEVPVDEQEPASPEMELAPIAESDEPLISAEPVDVAAGQEPIASSNVFDTPHATFAENGFDGPADAAEWVAESSSEPEAMADDDWFAREPEAGDPGATAVAPDAAGLAVPAAEDHDWFGDVPAADESGATAGEILFMAPDLMSVAPAGVDALGDAGSMDADAGADAVTPLDASSGDIAAPVMESAMPPASASEPPSLSGAEAAPAIGVASAPGGSRRDTPSPAPFVTETLAELYLKQGYREEALSIYQQLSERDPSNASLAEKIAAIRSEPGEAQPAAEHSRLEPASARSVRAFFSSIARRTPSAAAAQARLARTTAEAMGGAPERGMPPQEAAEPPFATAASALAKLFPATDPTPSDEGAAAQLAKAMSDPGRPSRAAERELSLDHLFRDVPGAGGATLDDFYGARSDSSGRAAQAGESAGAPDEGETDIRQFTAWLEGLRKK